jgi:ATP-binding cassette, subfamily B, bacterial
LNIPVREYWNLLVNYLKPQRNRVVLLAVLLAANIGLQLVSPQIMRVFIDTATASGALEQLTLLAVVFLAFAIAQQLVTVFSTYLGQQIGWTATNQLRYNLARHLLYLDLSFHNTRKPGELIERIDGDVTALANFFSQLIVQVIGNAIFLIGVLVLLVGVDWRVGAVMTIFVVVAMLTMLRLRNIGVPHWKAASQAGAEFYGFLEERLAGTQDIRANGAIEYVLLRFYGLLRTWFRKQVKAALMTNVMVNASFLLVALSNSLAFLLGAYLFTSGSVTFGTIYMIFYYTNILTRPIDLITRQMDDLQKAGASISRVGELLALTSNVVDGAGLTLPKEALKVQFDDVVFGYDDDNEIVLNGIGFTLQAGKVLGLLGRTGSGKTTMTRLLLRFYDPNTGAIQLNDHDIRSMKQTELRERVAMVTQNVQLFHASVRDNLTFFDPTIQDEVILDAIRDLGLWQWYAALPNGLDTVLESGGGGLSAGEAQLLAFTRIMLRDPGVIILDEASSRLDPATEELISRAVDKLVENRTAIIIAHRLHTVHRADYIMILERGQVLEYGERDKLADDPSSRFSYLLKTGMEEVLI